MSETSIVYVSLLPDEKLSYEKFIRTRRGVNSEAPKEFATLGWPSSKIPSDWLDCIRKKDDKTVT
jgi:hypothetical protein